MLFIGKSVWEWGYFIRIAVRNGGILNTVAEAISIDTIRYKELLEKYGAEFNPTTNMYYFSSYRKARTFLDSEKMLPYVIMGGLTK